MSRRVAIVGSREFANLPLVRSYVRRQLHADTIVVSGAARGVDETAAQEARDCLLEVEEIPADWSQGKGAGFARNTTIVEHADEIVAFWTAGSRGTLDTITKAVKAGKKVTIYGPTYGRKS